MRGRTRTTVAGTATIAAVALLLALPAFSGATLPPGANGRIVYQRGNDLWLMGANGSGQHALLETTMTETLASFSPTGARIAFFRSDSISQDVWTVRPDGLGERNLTNTVEPTEFATAWTPDGKRIYYSRQEQAADIDIWVARRDGVNAVPVTDTDNSDEYVVDVSPNGRRVLYTRSENDAFSTFEVWVMNANGSNQHPLTDDDPVTEFFASFSPNGRQIVFDRCQTNFSQCDPWLMKANGANERALLESAGVNERNPIFSPNGRRIAFTFCPPADPCEIATVNLSGGDLIDLTDTDATSESTPDWESMQRCGGRRATIVGDDGPDKIRGTRRRDVIDANGGQDVVRGRGGGDLICGGKGPDKLLGGKGRDRLLGGKGADALRGGPGLDRLGGGPGPDVQVQ